VCAVAFLRTGPAWATPWRLDVIRMSYLCICIQHPIAPRARYRGAWAAAPSH
jgi:hypothetical protein